MHIGDTETFELAFEEDDETADPSIRGKSLSYKVTLKELKQRDLLPLDDDFAKKVNETETLDELRQQIRDDIHQGKTTEGRTGVVNQIINDMAAQAEIDPPAVMVEEEVDHQLNHLKEDLQRSNTPWEGYLRLQGKSEDDIKDDLRPEAERRLRNSLFLQEVAKHENIEVTPDDIESEIARMAGPGANSDDEAAVAQAARMAQFYQSDYFRQMLRNELFERKLTERLIEIATEGQGAVLNAFVMPEPVIEAQAEVVESDADSVSSDDLADAVADASIIDVEGTTLSSPGDAAEVGASDVEEAAEAESTEGGYANAVEGDGENNVPDGYPIKGNAGSMIYHVPGGGSYENTVAEWYFATEEDAENAGFRAAKR
jgi:trigger factor